MASKTTRPGFDSLETENKMLREHRISVLIPCLNEADNLPYVLTSMPEWVHEVVIIDDHCTDDTVAVAREVMPRAVIVANERPPGKGNALRTGMEAASGDILVQLDADCSEDPAEINAFVGALLTGADYAKGSRFLEGGGTSDMPALRKWGNWALTLIVRMLFRGTKFTDLCYGYNAYWAHVAPILLDAEGFEIETVMNLRAVRAGLRIAEVPSFEAERIHGDGKLATFPDGWRVLKAILRERRDKRILAVSSSTHKTLSPYELAKKPVSTTDQQAQLQTNGGVLR
jgi:glycosyltransferase involved in cell wall biosynthesis